MSGHYTSSIASSQCSAPVASNTSLDILSVRRAFAELFSIPDLPFQSALLTAVSYVSRSIDADLRSVNVFSRRPEFINLFLIIMEIPVLDSLEFMDAAMPQFCKIFGLLPVNTQAQLARVWSRFTRDRLHQMVASVQQLITVRIVTSHWPQSSFVHDDECITGAARLLKVLYYASILGGRNDSPAVIAAETAADDAEGLQDLLEPGGAIGGVGRERKERPTQREDALGKELGVRPIDCREPLVASEDFVNESLSEAIEMDKDYTYYRTALMPDSASNAKFSFMMHPFLLTTAVKNLGMFFDNRIRMISERRASVLQHIYHGQAGGAPYLRLRIRRDHIIDDALINVSLSIIISTMSVS